MCAARALWLPRLDHYREIPKRALKLATASLCFIPRSGRGISARRVCKGKEQVGGCGSDTEIQREEPDQISIGKTEKRRGTSAPHRDDAFFVGGGTIPRFQPCSAGSLSSLAVVFAAALDFGGAWLVCLPSSSG